MGQVKMGWAGPTWPVDDPYDNFTPICSFDMKFGVFESWEIELLHSTLLGLYRLTQRFASRVTFKF